MSAKYFTVVAFIPFILVKNVYTIVYLEEILLLLFELTEVDDNAEGGR